MLSEGRRRAKRSFFRSRSIPAPSSEATSNSFVLLAFLHFLCTRCGQSGCPLYQILSSLLRRYEIAAIQAKKTVSPSYFSDVPVREIRAHSFPQLHQKY
jgi:hypothetical protein